MSTANPDVLLSAYSHIKAGELTTARTLLGKFLRTNPNSERAWLLLSLAVTEPAQQRDCLQRVLLLNPFNREAQTRLAQLNAPEAAPRVEASPDPPPAPAPDLPYIVGARSAAALSEAPTQPIPEAAPPTRRQTGPLNAPAPINATAPAKSRALQNWMLPAIVIVWVLIFVSLIALGVYVFFGGGSLFTNPNAAVPPTVAVPRGVAAASHTPALPTLPPEWTASPTPNAAFSPTPTVTRTPTSTPTFAPPNPTVGADLDVIAQQVADVRGLASKGEVPRYVIARNQAARTLEGLVLSADYRAELQAQQKVLVALGLIKPTFDLVKYGVRTYSAGIGGFYLPWSQQLFVINDARYDGVERYVFSHEYTHALTDQHFGFGTWGVYPDCTRAQQECQAIRAVVEGDATLAMQLWLRQYARPQDFVDLENYRPVYETLPEEFPPPFVGRELGFPYREGYAFVAYLYERGDWARVNEAYRTPPTTTEQILHPEKYLAGESALAVSDPRMDAALGPEWQRVQQDSFGEWTTFLILAYSADLSAQVDPEVAERAAAGWGGDTMQIYFNDATQQSALAAHWLWDTPGDASEFRTALTDYLGRLYRGARLTRTDGQCWEANGQTTCVFAKGKETLWLQAPTQDILTAMLAEYPDWP